MKKLLFTIVLSIIYSSSFAQWEWQNPYPQPNNLNDVYFINQEIGWAVGDEGTIIKTEDSGITYSLQTSSKLENLNAVKFNDTLVGYIVGDSGLILKTINGGDEWVEITYDSSLNFNDIETMCEKVWVVGEKGIIIYSTDNGITWELQHYDEQFTLMNVCFTDSLTGWSGGDKYLLKTTDGGKSWIPKIFDPSLWGICVCFIDSDIGWISGQSGYGGRIMHTNDGGDTWFIQFEEYIDNLTYDIEFIDSNHGWVIAGGSVPKYEHYSSLKDEKIPTESILYTKDGGLTWEYHSFGVYGILNRLHFLDNNEGWVVGSNGQIHHTLDGGDNWITNGIHLPHKTLYDVSFTDNENGWAVGGGGPWPVSYNIMLQTKDGGANWEIIYINGTGILSSVHFIDASNGWVVRHGGHMTTWDISHTIDGGNSWEYINIGEDGTFFNDVYFTTLYRGWIVGKNGSIWHTGNQGITWEEQSIGVNKDLYAVFFIDSDNGWIAGDGIILNTNNGGITWEEQYSESNSWEDIYFTNRDLGWVVGDTGIICTNDGGKTWEIQLLANEIEFSSVHFTDQLNGWAVGANKENEGVIMYTADGGMIWERYSINIDRGLKVVCFTNQSNGWVMGQKSTILKTSNGGALFIDESELYDKRKLKINQYPNPFTTSTTIEYELKQSDNVSLTIYNHLGQIVYQAQENQAQGKQQLIWNAERHPDGIYYFRLHAGEQTTTGKMVKVR